MRLSLILSLSLLLWSGQSVRAQLAPPDDFFHSGAQLYISNNIPAALERVESGLKMYPDDEKLKKLEELLKQQQQQQQQQNQQQQNQQDQQQSKDQQKQNPQNQPSSSKDAQDQPKPDEQKQDPADQKKDKPQKPSEPQKGSADKSDEEKQNGEGQPVQPGQLTPEEAKKLLDAQKGHERLLQLRPQEKPRDSRRPVKDW